jgi:hypothetical protein
LKSAKYVSEQQFSFAKPGVQRPPYYKAGGHRQFRKFGKKINQKAMNLLTQFQIESPV